MNVFKKWLGALPCRLFQLQGRLFIVIHPIGRMFFLCRAFLSGKMELQPTTKSIMNSLFQEFRPCAVACRKCKARLLSGIGKNTCFLAPVLLIDHLRYDPTQRIGMCIVQEVRTCQDNLFCRRFRKFPDENGFRKFTVKTPFIREIGRVLAVHLLHPSEAFCPRNNIHCI